MLLHALLSPAPLLLGLGSLLPFVAPRSEDLEPEEAVDAIPVDLVAPQAPRPAEPAPEAAPPEPQTPAPPEPAVRPVPPPTKAPPKPEPAPPPEEPPSAAEPAAKEFADPVTMAGSAGDLADSNAHVRLMIYTDVIRTHPLGPRVGGLLRRTPQWRDFFGPSGVDPVLDVDRVLIAGPQLRDSSNVIAVIQHRLPDAAIEQALERLVSRQGNWLRREPPLARARADRAERLFSAPRPGIVAVAPPSAEKSVRRLGPSLRFGPGPEGVAVQAFIDTPHRPLAALGLRIPKSLSWVRAEIVPESGGGVTIRLLAQDESPKAARKHAAELQTLLRSAAEVDFRRMGTLGALASLAFGGAKQKVVESIDLYAEKDQIRGLVRVTRTQLLNLSDLLDAFLPPEPRRKEEPGKDEAPEQTEETDGPQDSSGDSSPAPGEETGAADEESGQNAPSPRQAPAENPDSDAAAPAAPDEGDPVAPESSAPRSDVASDAATPD